jgi:hypothetical protein
MRPWAAAALALALVASVATERARSQALPADADRDGVADDVDLCPDTPPYELVDADGCPVCDCDDAWDARGEYLRCINQEIRARRTDGRLTGKDARLVSKAARNSTCGYDTKVRCCIPLPGKPTGMCRIMDEVRCDATLLGADAVQDLDSGSCFPNPCAQ